MRPIIPKMKYCRGSVWLKKLRIVIITKEPSEIVTPLLDSEHEIIGIIEGIPYKQNIKKTKKMLYEIYRVIKGKNLKKVCSKNKIPYFYMNNGSSKKLESWIMNLNPDLIVVRRLSQLLKKNIFTIPKYGTINLHSSLLPKYRGPNPTFWTYYYKDLELGATIHYIDEGEDTGDILNQDRILIDLGTTENDYKKKLEDLGIRLLLKTIDQIALEKTCRIKQVKGDEIRARDIKMSEHSEIIDWASWDIERIWHLLRGTQSWLNAIEQPKHFYLGQRWEVLNYVKMNMSGYIPSKIYRDDVGYFAACKDGKIYLKVELSFKTLLITLLKKIYHF